MKDTLKTKILADRAISAETKKLIFVLDSIGAPVDATTLRQIFTQPTYAEGIWEINNCTDYARAVVNPALDCVQIFTSKQAYNHARKAELQSFNNLPDYVNNFMYPKW